MPKVIPFAPLPMHTLKTVSAPFIRYSAIFNKMFPNFGKSLRQAEIPADEREYAAIILFLVTFYFLFFTFLLTIILSRFTPHFLILGPTIGVVMAFLIFVQTVMYPKMIIRKKMRSIELNLVFALRTILIEIKSGVSLFDSLNVVSRGNYAALSDEFRKVVESINTGTPEEEALEELGDRNPSHFLRKVIWQIVNGLKAGADVSSVLSETVSSMIREQRIAITKFGAQLKILSLMYMMIGVIMPALGLTFLIVLGSFPQITIDQVVFWVMLAAITVMEFMYIGIIKSRRPSIIG
ncbi:MAG: type II secretion system F family protein [Candidatus Diapherotrites archaeon]|uniref:Type II secretion system F family protein n=1 Tax=Candidatus Iainarchaeum sp. TaxID=3101447 RepID=A0A939C7N9_9ARCH|nr:type II secretion system F family protein [Candidatus Diapherotrites archaeon]